LLALGTLLHQFWHALCAFVAAHGDLSAASLLCRSGPALPSGDMVFKRLRLYPKPVEAHALVAAIPAGKGAAPPRGPPGGSFSYPTVVRQGFDPRNVNSAVQFVWQLPSTSDAFRAQEAAMAAALVSEVARTDPQMTADDDSTPGEMDLACAIVRSHCHLTSLFIESLRAR